MAHRHRRTPAPNAGKRSRHSGHVSAWRRGPICGRAARARASFRDGSRGCAYARDARRADEHPAPGATTAVGRTRQRDGGTCHRGPVDGAGAAGKGPRVPHGLPAHERCRTAHPSHPRGRPNAGYDRARLPAHAPGGTHRGHPGDHSPTQPGCRPDARRCVPGSSRLRTRDLGIWPKRLELHVASSGLDYGWRSRRHSGRTRCRFPGAVALGGTGEGLLCQRGGNGERRPTW
jgi:hypothetical protein